MPTEKPFGYMNEDCGDYNEGYEAGKADMQEEYEKRNPKIDRLPGLLGISLRRVDRVMFVGEDGKELELVELTERSQDGKWNLYVYFATK